MPLPDHILARRAAQRARRRRRQRAAFSLGWAAVLGLLLAAAVLALGGRGSVRAEGTRGAASIRVQPAAGRSGARARPLRLTPARARLEAAGNARIRELAELGLPLYCAGHRGRALALTFDDGPGPYTYLALRKLRTAHERATFFVVGNSMNYFPGYLPHELRLAALGDHTYTHADLAVLPRAQVYAEIESDRRQIQRQSGQPVDLFRPPYGALDPTVLSVARSLGLLTVMWTQDSQDSLGASYAQIIANVKAALRPGAIILMHENHGQTIRALTTLLPLLRRRHLQSVSLPELLATDPPSATELRHGQAACGGVRVTAGSS